MNDETGQKTITVKLNVLNMPDGRQHIIPSLDELTEALGEAKYALEWAEALADPDSADSIDYHRAEVTALKRSIAQLQRALDDAPALLAQCQEVTYAFYRPSFGAVIELEKAARIETNGVEAVDLNLMMMAAMPVILVGGQETLDSMPSNHAQKLWSRWREEVYQDPIQNIARLARL